MRNSPYTVIGHFTLFIYLNIGEYRGENSINAVFWDKMKDNRDKILLCFKTDMINYKSSEHRFKYFRTNLSITKFHNKVYAIEIYKKDILIINIVEFFEQFIWVKYHWSKQ